MLSIILLVALTVIIWLLVFMARGAARAVGAFMVAPMAVGLLHLHSYYQVGYWDPFWPISVVVGTVVSSLVVLALELGSKRMLGEPFMSLPRASMWKARALWVVIAAATSLYLYQVADEGISQRHVIDAQLQLKAERLAVSALNEAISIPADAVVDTTYDRGSQLYRVTILAHEKVLGTVVVDAVKFTVMAVNVS